MVLGPEDSPPDERPEDPMGVENALDRSDVWYWELDDAGMLDVPDMPGEPYELGTYTTTKHFTMKANIHRFS